MGITANYPIERAHALLPEVLQALAADIDLTRIHFPREILWLNGAPGAGKGTNTRLIMKLKGFTAGPVVISDLLSSPEFVRIKNSGGLVGDKDVVVLIARKLLDPVFQSGVIVDGYPRTPVQAEFIRLFHEQLVLFGQPSVFRLVVLNVTEEVAIARQLKRGREVQAHNEEVRRTGIGQLQELRTTDVDPEAARKRCQVFQEQTVAALDSLKNTFPCHFIDASGDLETVSAAIAKSLGG